MKSTNQALEMLQEQYGSSIDELMEQATMDSVAASVCMNDNCEFTDEYEPDCRDGHCPNCDTNTVQSILVIAGII